MSAILMSGPLAEPVNVAALQQHLRLEAGDNDLLSSLISAARMTIEAQSGLRLMHQKWRVLIDEWPHQILPLALRPVHEIVSIGLVNSQKTLLATSYEIVQTQDKSYLHITTNDLPTPARSRFGIRVDLIAGYGATAENVPEDLRLAVLNLAAHWYDLEDWTQFHGRDAIPANIALLVNNYRGPHL